MDEMFFLASATITTIALALCALLAGLLLAILFAIWEMSHLRVVALTGTAAVMILRGLPEVLVILSVYYGSSQLLLSLADGFIINLYFIQVKLQLELVSFELSPFLCGVIALALLYSAYASQTLRGSLKAVPLSQRQAGLALGLPRHTLFFRIIIPQMWRHALPGLGNQWLVLLKDTALVSLISVNDLMLQSQSIAIRTREPFTWYIIAALLYLLVTLLSQQLLRWLESRVTLFERRSA